MARTDQLNGYRRPNPLLRQKRQQVVEVPDRLPSEADEEIADGRLIKRNALHNLFVFL